MPILSIKEHIRGSRVGPMYQKAVWVSVTPERAIALAVPLSARQSMEAYMETMLFTDHNAVVLAITTIALALVLSVLGLAATRRTRSDLQHQLNRLRWER